MTMAHRTLKIILFSASLALVMAASASSQIWRRIVPLRTARIEVERLIGPAKIVGTVPTYYFEDVTVEMFYTKDKCGDPLNFYKWNVPPDTVVSIHIVPKKPRRLHEMGLGLSKFRKEKGDWDLPTTSRLINDEEGLTLSLESNTVYAYSYGPKASDRPLRCPEYSEEEERRRRDCFPAALSIDCASEEIGIGKSVECKVRTDAPKPSFKWSVSRGASIKSARTDTVMVTLADATSKSVSVSVAIVSPNACLDTASIELRVVKGTKRFHPKRR